MLEFFGRGVRLKILVGRVGWLLGVADQVLLESLQAGAGVLVFLLLRERRADGGPGCCRLVAVVLD